MSTVRSDFITALFRHLSGVEYLWLKAVLPRPEDTPTDSDIDLFLRKNDLPTVLLFVVKHEAITSCNATFGNAATYLQLTFTDGSQLKLDLLTALVRKQYEYLSEAYLFANRIWKDGVATYSPEALLEHVLLFSFLNEAGLPPKYVRHFETLPIDEQQRLLAFVNSKYGTGFPSFQKMGLYTVSAQEHLVNYLSRQPENAPAKQLRRLGHYLGSLLRNGSQPLPQVITFTGVDGAGKTTLLHDLKSVLENKLGQQVTVLRHRPSLLPILSAWRHGKQAAEAKSVANLPRQGMNASTLGSLLRFGYYFADYLLGQPLVWWHTLRGGTVIFDRYYFDFIVDAKRSNIALGSALPKWLYRFVAKPDLSIFLYADPDTIRQRKQELPKADIEKMTGQYLELFEELQERHDGCYLCLENHDRAATLDAILKHCFMSDFGFQIADLTATPTIRTPQSEIRNQLVPC